MDAIVAYPRHETEPVVDAVRRAARWLSLKDMKFFPHQITALAREVPRDELRIDPQLGDLVIDPLAITFNPEAIGWLVAHDEAPYNEDGSGETREVWHVVPLSGPVQTARYGDGAHRWENATFYALPDRLAELASHLAVGSLYLR